MTRAENVSPAKDAEHPVLCEPMDGDPPEYVTVDYAVSRITGYYQLTDAEAREALLGGTPFRTISYIYRVVA